MTSPLFYTVFCVKTNPVCSIAFHGKRGCPDSMLCVEEIIFCYYSLQEHHQNDPKTESVVKL